MARTSIAVAEVPFQTYIAGITFGAVDSANGMMFVNHDGRTVLLVKNGSGSSITVTVSSVADEAGRTGNDSIALAAGGQTIVAPKRPAWWNQKSGADIGMVYVDFTSATSVTVAALRMNL